MHISKLLSKGLLIHICSVHVRRARHDRQKAKDVLSEPERTPVLVVAARRIEGRGFRVVVDVLEVLDQPQEVFWGEMGAGPLVRHVCHEVTQEVAVAFEGPLVGQMFVALVVHGGDSPAIVGNRSRHHSSGSRPQSRSFRLLAAAQQRI